LQKEKSIQKPGKYGVFVKLVLKNPGKERSSTRRASPRKHRIATLRGSAKPILQGSTHAPTALSSIAVREVGALRATNDRRRAGFACRSF